MNNIDFADDGSAAGNIGRKLSPADEVHSIWAERKRK
jgi:hypothetical protein